jgi:hypothetical protein
VTHLETVRLATGVAFRSSLIGALVVHRLSGFRAALG